MADTQQGVRQQSARDAAGTTDTHSGDLRALFESVATVPAGSAYNEAFMLWLQDVTGSSLDNINDLAALFASQQDDTYNWSSAGPLLGGGNLQDAFFDYNPVANGAVPGTSTVARASDAYYFNGSVIVQVGSGVIRPDALVAVGGAKGFLREPAASNIHQYSTFSTGTLLSASIIRSTVADFSIGLGNQRFTGSGVNGQLGVQFHPAGINSLVSTQYTVHAVVQDQGFRYLYLRGPSNQVGNVPWGVFDVQDGVIVGAGGPLTDSLKLWDWGSGWYKCQMTYTTGTSIGNAATWAMWDPSGAIPSESVGTTPQTTSTGSMDMAHGQVEVSGYSTSPIPTNNNVGSRVADSFTDVAWPATASAIVDCTVVNPLSTQMNMLGFGAAAASVLTVDGANTARLINAGIDASITAGDTYEDERHKFGMSLQTNEGIIVDDEDNDDTDAAGVPGQGTIYLGSSSDLSGQPVIIHRAQVAASVLTVAQLKGLTS